MSVHDFGENNGLPDDHCSLRFPRSVQEMECKENHIEEEESGRFKCEQCGRCYRHAGSLANHKKTHEVGSFHCPVCTRVLSNALALKNHLRIHTSSKSYTCAVCGKAFRLLAQLITHHKVHKSQGSQQDSAEKNELQAKAVQENGGSVDSIEQNCSTVEHFCKQEFDMAYNSKLINNGVTKLVHLNNCSDSQSSAVDDYIDRPFKCDQCEKTYRHHGSLINHKKSHQLGTFECPVCYKQFNNLAALNSHQRTHTKSRFQSSASFIDVSSLESPTDPCLSPSEDEDTAACFCHLCGVVFPDKNSFKDHVLMHNISSSPCELPDSLSTSNSDFFLHSHGHTHSSAASLEKQEAGEHAISQTYTCAYCGERYTDINNLKDHYFSHNSPTTSNSQADPLLDSENLSHNVQGLRSDKEAKGQRSSSGSVKDRRFTCQICGKSYRHAGSLINHKRSHQTGSYQCSICCKFYPHLAALQSHLRSHRARPPSLPLSTEGDWLSPEPLTLEVQQSYLNIHNQEEEHSKHSILENGSDTSHSIFGGSHNDDLNVFHEHFGNGISMDGAEDALLTAGDQPAERHMCADCGETYGDIIGIKSHVCPQRCRQQEHLTSGFLSNLDLQDLGDETLLENGKGLRGAIRDSLGQDLSHEQSQSGDDHDMKDDDTEDDGEVYQCSVCGNQYTSLRALRSHLRGNTHFQAASTSPGFSPLSFTEDNWRRSHESEGSLMICSTCGESFSRELDLQAHQLLHGQDHAGDVAQGKTEEDACSIADKMKEKSHICGKCGMFCTDYNQLGSHQCMVKDKGQKERGAREGQSLEQHLEEMVARGCHEVMQKSCESGDRPHRCDQCGRTYRHPSSLLNHKKSHKTGVFRCLVCQKRFYNLLALKSHHRTHFDMKRHKCEECGKAFKIQKQLVNHLRVHKENHKKVQEFNKQLQSFMHTDQTETDQGVECSPSNNIINSKSRRGNSTSHGQTRVAKKSGHVKDTQKELQVDVRPEEMQRKGAHHYACDECGRTYRHVGSLVNHKKSHKTGKYNCTICKSTYANQLALKNHLRTHFTDKKFSCQNCGKTFRRQKQLSSHKCSFHGKKMPVEPHQVSPNHLQPNCNTQPFNTSGSTKSHVNGMRNNSDTDIQKDSRPFVCNICNRTYRHAGSLLNHKNTHKTGNFSCSYCSKPFSNAMALRNHTRIHTQKKKHICSTCGKAFRLATILLNHQKVHADKSVRFSCPACSKTFQGKSAFEKHRCGKSQEAGSKDGGRKDRANVSTADESREAERRFKCEQCDRSYRHASSLLNHKNTHTTGIYHCGLCLKTFSNLLALKNHRRIHSETRRHSCPDCSKTFRVSSQLRSHRRVHLRQRELVCAPCQQSFRSRAGLKKHQELHCQARKAALLDASVHSELGWGSGLDAVLTHPQGLDPDGLPPQLPLFPRVQCLLPEFQEREAGGTAAVQKAHVCEHCGRTYRHASSLLNHKNSHKTGSYVCSTCQKEFSNLMALKNHRRIHTEPKRYVCPDCGKAFRVSTQLICHRRVHTKEKPFSCLLCGKSFSSKSNLRHHQKVHRNAFDASLDMGTSSFLDLGIDTYL